MCTAINHLGKYHYFGRTLDLEASLGECVVITPRNYDFRFRENKKMSNHYAMIGMALPTEGYPLYFDATNEMGLSMAGLNFPGNAHYYDFQYGYRNVSAFEFIPYILSHCQNLQQASDLLSKCSLWNKPFSSNIALTPLHWLVGDRTGSVVVESTEEGLQLYRNPAGVLTNNPPFPFHQENLRQYLHLSPSQPCNRFSRDLKLTPFGLGHGTMGLPGDLSSPSRFIRAAFYNHNYETVGFQNDPVGSMFHILGSVTQNKGASVTNDNKSHYTVYTGCCDTQKGIYYYSTYENQQISAVDMHSADLTGTKILCYPLNRQQKIFFQNSKMQDKNA